MTVIDRILFHFQMTDEEFARNLYADWDEFCHRCVTNVIEEFFSSHDTKDFYMEIDSLDLDLGAIPQDNFMHDFPIRLREALKKNFISKMQEMKRLRPYPDVAFQGMSSTFPVVIERRLDNFLHYLEHGFFLPEWTGYEFDLNKELELFMDRNHIRQIAGLLVSKPYVFDRLSMHIGYSDFAMDILYAVITSDAIGEYEKRRHIAATLERSPQTVIRFIHETDEAGNLDMMAGWIENPQVKSIMEAETENHAEIDLPEYWYRLYGWLIEYYPFNGVPMFGDKQHFRLYLNRSLLLFIHRRTYPSYLSKAELTVQFLMAVFGAGHYLAVLDIIYHNQQLNPDGSPAGADSYAWELYYMLLQLSLIKTDTYQAKLSDNDSLNETADSEIALSLVADRENIGQWLENTSFSEAAKKHLINRMVSERNGSLLRWLKSGPAERHLLMLASFLDDRSFCLLVASCSLQLTEILSQISVSVGNIVANVSWLRNIDRSRFLQMLKQVVLGCIADGSCSTSYRPQELLLHIVERLYNEMSGAAGSQADGASVTPVGTSHIGTSHIGTSDSRISGLESCGNRMALEPVRELFNVLQKSVRAFPVVDNAPEYMQYILPTDKEMAASDTFASLKALLLDRSIPAIGKKWHLIQWFDTYHGDELTLLSFLSSERILAETVETLGDSLLRQIAVRLSALVCDNHIHWMVCCIVKNMEVLAAAVSRPPKDLWSSLLLALSSEGNVFISTSTERGLEIIVRLLADIVGIDNVAVALEALSHIYSPENSLLAGEGFVAVGAEDEPFQYLVYRMKRFVESQKTYHIDAHKVQIQLEYFLENPSQMKEWLHNATVPVWQKREFFCSFISRQPDKALKFLRESIMEAGPSAALWLEFLDSRLLLKLLDNIAAKWLVVLERTVSGLSHASVGGKIGKGISGKELDMAIMEALVLMLTEKYDTDTINQESVVRQFMDTLHYTITGNSAYTMEECQEWESAVTLIFSVVQADSHVSEITPTEWLKVKNGNQASLLGEMGKGQVAFDTWLIWLQTPSVSDTEKSQLLQHYARWQPDLLWKLIRYSSVKTVGDSSSATSVITSAFPMKLWTSWLDRDTLLEMVSCFSLTVGEALRQTMTLFIEKHNMSDEVLTETLIKFLAAHPLDRIHYTDASTVVNDYISLCGPCLLPECSSTRGGQQAETAQRAEPVHHNNGRSEEQERLVKAMEEELHITESEQLFDNTRQPDYIEIPNAGLCLLAIWFTRLFDMLGLLEEREDGKKDLKNREARIRAIFILQRILTDEPREYKEQELAFNRILTGCPFYVPLPKTLVLTNKEIQTVESMLSGVKSNWDKLKNTSVRGFRHNFIERPGKLEQREDKWVLYVENRSYDILLDSLPWSYRQIRMPWLKKRIHVVWRDKEEFDFDNLLN